MISQFATKPYQSCRSRSPVFFPHSWEYDTIYSIHILLNCPIGHFHVTLFPNVSRIYRVSTSEILTISSISMDFYKSLLEKIKNLFDRDFLSQSSIIYTLYSVQVLKIVSNGICMQCMSLSRMSDDTFPTWVTFFFHRRSFRVRVRLFIERQANCIVI